MGGASGSTDLGAGNGPSPSAGASGSAGIGVPPDTSHSDERSPGRDGDETIGGASASAGPGGSGGGGSAPGGASASEQSGEKTRAERSSLPVEGDERDNIASRTNRR